jgi:hypothetical protein
MEKIKAEIDVVRRKKRVDFLRSQMPITVYYDDAEIKMINVDNYMKPTFNPSRFLQADSESEKKFWKKARALTGGGEKIVLISIILGWTIYNPSYFISDEEKLQKHLAKHG